MYYINGKVYENLNEAKIECEDLAMTRGYGVFDFLITYNGKPFHLDEHLNRLKKSAEIIKLPFTYSNNEIKTIIYDLLSKQEQGKDYSIKILVSGGLSSDGITPSMHPSLTIIIKPKPSFAAHLYQHGIKLKTTTHKRSFPDCKSINYIPAIVAMQEGRLEGYDDALYISNEGTILESTTSNIFFVKGNTIITPPLEEVLDGITRKVVLEIARSLFKVEVRPVSLAEVSYFDEAFITSSSRELMPVSKINHYEFSPGAGPVTLRLQALFRQYTKEYAKMPIPSIIKELGECVLN